MEKDYSNHLDLVVNHWFDVYNSNKEFQKILNKSFPDFFSTINYLHGLCNEINSVDIESPKRKTLIVEFLNVILIIKSLYISMTSNESFETIYDGLIDKMNEASLSEN